MYIHSKLKLFAKTARKGGKIFVSDEEGGSKSNMSTSRVEGCGHIHSKGTWRATHGSQLEHQRQRGRGRAEGEAEGADNHGVTCELPPQYIKGCQVE